MCLQNKKLPKLYLQFTKIFLRLWYFFPIESAAIKLDIGAQDAAILLSALFTIGVANFLTAVLSTYTCIVWGVARRNWDTDVSVDLSSNETAA